MDERWPGRLFQMLDSAEENDFEITVEVSLKVIEMVMKTENRSDHEKCI